MRPKRIVSLVPSLTELLFDLDVSDRLVGRTRFCIRPKDRVDEVPIIGGTKSPRLDKIRDTQPDLIIANREENRQDDISELREEFEVYLSDVRTVEDALITIHEIGERLDVTDRADDLNRRIMQKLEERPNEQPLQTAYFIWRDPWMVVGHNTYIHDIMQHWGLTNLFGDRARYPQITLDELNRRNPELVLLSSEPYPFKEQHEQEVQEACPKARVLPVDGQWFSWYGSRMLEAFDKLNTWRKAIS